MHTKDFIFDDSSKREVFEKLVKSLEDRVRILNVLVQSLCTFFTKTVVSVDFDVFVGTSQQMELLWIFKLKGQKQAQNFQVVSSSVYVIAQEYIVKTVDITILAWATPMMEQSEQITILTMDTSIDLGWDS